MPSDLLELTRQIHQAPILGAGLAESMIGSYRKGQEIEQMRREMEAQQQLRQLFARNQQPSINEIGQYAPELAMKYNPMGLENLKLQSEIMRSQQQMQESQQKQEFERLNRQGQAVVPLIDEYHNAIQQGMSQDQAANMFRAKLGQLIPALEQAGIGFKAKLTEQVTPEMLEPVYAGVNAPTMRLQAQLEQQRAMAGELGRSQVAPRMTAEQAYGGFHMTPEGFAMPIPPVRQGGGMAGLSEQQLIQMANNPRMPAEQQAAVAEIERRAGGNVPTYGPGATPQQLQQFRARSKAEEAAAVEEAKTVEQDRQQMKKTVNQYKTLRSPAQIEQIIAASKTGNLDDALRDLGKVFGVATDKGTATAKLKTIVQQFAKLSPFAPGSQSDKEYQARLDEIGAIDSSTPVNERLGQFGEYIHQLKQSMIDRGEFTPQQLLSMVQSGHFTKEEAAQIANRLFANEGAAQ